jgi:hypothetical protein
VIRHVFGPTFQTVIAVLAGSSEMVSSIIEFKATIKPGRPSARIQNHGTNESGCVIAVLLEQVRHIREIFS